MVLEQNNLEQKTKELDELIDLAEKVSSKIKSLKNAQSSARQLMLAKCILLVLMGIMAISPTFRKPDITFFGFAINFQIIFLFAAIYFALSMIKNIRDIFVEKEIEQEIQILNKLHNMITTHKRAFDSELGVVTNAIYEMKLSRIEFDFDNNSKNPFFKLITSILG